MKEYTNSHGLTVKLGERFNYKTTQFTIAKIYHDRLGVTKILTNNGVIFVADTLKYIASKKEKIE